MPRTILAASAVLGLDGGLGGHRGGKAGLALSVAAIAFWYPAVVRVGLKR